MLKISNAQLLCTIAYIFIATLGIIVLSIQNIALYSEIEEVEEYSVPIILGIDLDSIDDNEKLVAFYNRDTLYIEYDTIVKQINP